MKPTAAIIILLFVSYTLSAQPAEATLEQVRYELSTTQKAISDLVQTFTGKYDADGAFQKRLDGFKNAIAEVEKANDPLRSAKFIADFRAFRSEALLANPLLDFEKLLFVKRRNIEGKFNENEFWQNAGFPTNHECKTTIKQYADWDNELAILSPVSPSGRMTTLYRPAGNAFIGDYDLHWNADKIIFTTTTDKNWTIAQVGADGKGVKRIEHPDDYAVFEPIFLPNGGILFSSTASFVAVPCWHGLKDAAHFYIADGDGKNMRQVCFDQDFDLHPVVLPSGQIMYVRWDYTGISHVHLRQLMVMNPDGTGQRAVYGANTYFPNSLYNPKPLPGSSGKFVCTLSGYHDPPKSGLLVVIDLSKGYRNDDAIVAHISGTGKKLVPAILDGYLYELGEARFPLFNAPYPLNDKYFLVSAQMTARGDMAIYVADIYDNLILLTAEKGYHLFEPRPMVKKETPKIIPSKIDLKEKQGTVYIDNIYKGPGLKDYPHKIKEVRVIGYNFGYPGLAGPNLIGWGGPWEPMTIIGKTKIEEDGSAFFRVPANTPIAFQALDSLGQAVQLMRSWVAVMPGETRSCVGCHESPAETAGVRQTLASRTVPKQLSNWYGQPRNFDFEREVQPVLDHYCVSCHNGSKKDRPDLRSEQHFPNYHGQRLDMHGVKRAHPEFSKLFGLMTKYTPAYDAMLPYVRRVGVEDDAEMLNPGVYAAENSELFQMMRKGHYGVNLDERARDALITWIDLNAPCHGTWTDIMNVPDNAVEKRRKYQQLYGAPPYDFEKIIHPEPFNFTTKNNPPQRAATQELTADRFPLTPEIAAQLQASKGEREKVIKISPNVKLVLVRIPAGECIMGSKQGHNDELPQTKVTFEKGFWMGKFEITNAQMRLFDPAHDSRTYSKRDDSSSDRGATLNKDNQPAVRVSWNKAMEFCRWLSEITGMKFSLPTEAQWEYAARAGSDQQMSYGSLDDNFAGFANFADLGFTIGRMPEIKLQYGYPQITGLLNAFNEGAALADRRYFDFGWVTLPVGSYHPNVWGLYDTHGNASEWTLSTYKPYPYSDSDGRNNPAPYDVKVVRGGSFADRPARGTLSFRQFYPPWVANEFTGFRVVAE